ncbi:hypothetical protein [Agromyces sp. SYSU T00194]|uniref:hypothetical protein n=1 Tax=Agromyces chitinivorans TaxID=3158560 RepID=UPI00339083D9
MSTALPRGVAAVAVVGAVAQLAYGVLAIAFPWPAIAGTGGELVWIVVNLGWIAALAGWAMVVAPGRTVVVGAAIASVGFAVRIVAAAVTIASPASDPLPLVLASIALTLGGVAVVAVGTFLVRPVRSAVTWVPAIALVVEFGIASMYSANTVLHFILLGLAWGAVLLAMAIVVAARARAAAAAEAPVTTAA